MPEWENRTLGDFAPFKYGKGISQADRTGGEFPVFGSGGIIGYSKKPLISTPCIIIGRKGTVGSSNYAADGCHPIDTTFYVDEVNDGDMLFTYYLIKTLRLESMNEDSAVPGLNRNTAHAVTIKVPPLDEQVRIANVLSSLDNLIDNNKQQIQKTLELSRAYYDLIVKNAENTVELKTIAEFNKQSTKKQDSGKVTYIEISNVKDGIIEWCDEIDWSEAATSARRLVSHGDTIWSNVRPNRRSHSLVLDKPDNMVVTTGMTVISPISEKIGAAFLFATLDSEAYSSYLAQHADGTTYPTVGEEHFANSIITMPEQKEIGQFEKVMFPLWEDAKRAEMDNIKLSKMRDELLPLLISGEITVKEAEEQIEG